MSSELKSYFLYLHDKREPTCHTMRQTIGGILAAAGFLGIIYFGYRYFDESESFEALGADVAVSTGDYTPIIISAIVLILGIVIAKLK